MIRHWLTSTTALALVLNAAAPLPSTASSVTDRGAELRLAQNDADTTPDEVIVDELEEVEAASEEPLTAADLEAVEQDGDDDDDGEGDTEERGEDQPSETPDEAGGESEETAETAVEDEASEPEALEEPTDTQDTASEDAAAEEAPVEADPAASEGDSAMNGDEQIEPDEQDTPSVEETPAPADETQEDADQDADSEAVKDAQTDTEGEQTEPETEVAPEQGASGEADAAADESAPAESGEGADAQIEEPTSEPTSEAVEEATQPDADDTPADDATEDSAEDEASEAIPEISAEEQAAAVERDDEGTKAAAAAADDSEAVETQEATVTEDQARASDEEFETTASGEPTPDAPKAKKKDNDLLKAVGAAAALGLGAYAVGKMLDSGGEVVSNTGDRAVVRDPSGAYRIIKDDDTLLRRPGADVRTQTFTDGSTRNTVTEADGSSTVTIRAADGRVLRRTRVLADGRTVELFDDTDNFERVNVRDLERAGQEASRYNYDYSAQDVDRLRMALSASNGEALDRSYSLNQIRRIDAVRHLVPVIALDAINFKTGSAVIEASEAESLAGLGNAMRDAIEKDPTQVFLIEGHTDTVGAASYNLALSDRRAESVALALSEYYDVPPANMIVQGYGEADLRVRQAGNVRANRRGAVRNITPLLRGTR